MDVGMYGRRYVGLGMYGDRHVWSYVCIDIGVYEHRYVCT